jgi:uncharacterized membrane protein
MLHVTRSITVRCPREAAYQFWRDLENLPRFMQHLQSVHVADDGRTHWVARAPADQQVEWDAEIVDERPNERLGWRSMPGSDIRHEGCIEFSDAPFDRGTEIRVELRYDPPAGAAGAKVAKLFGEEPSQQIRDDLRRFKQVMELGEVVLSEGSPEGVGEGPLKERPAQPAGREARR